MRFEDFLNEGMLTEATFEHHEPDFRSRKIQHAHTFVGKKVGETPGGHHIYSGKSTAVGKKHTQLALHVVHKNTGQILASHDKGHAHGSDEKLHKQAIEHAKSTDHFWSDREPHKNFHNLHNHTSYLKKPSKK